ncbi:glycosyltransferase family 39 protein [Nocardia sp. CDC160]|uniref:glycosyltransferase family 39 protein n=1 Tax=Nocardia sp. CDC160 TaxID=3112166 RepID=UPI002DBF805D|nr:glycosyltransferase family 39 protein [Nocardia sp. CDC160]MEC3916878.1 glycosyltransferase family 39 protein [Nocardia sp. CDC160]
MTAITGVEGDSVPMGDSEVVVVGHAEASTNERTAGSGAGGSTRWSTLLAPPGKPRWERPATLALLVATAVVYLWGLGGAGWGNGYYAAAVQSGTQSWKALLFASLDPQNSITVDKPPAAMWVMGLSGRIFGFNSWSMFAPQALMGVAAVWLLLAAVRRWAGPGAGLIAGIGLAVTPVAAMMFRFNNPDALMLLLLVAAAYCTVRGIDAHGERFWSASTGWLVGAGVLMGFGFLAKMGQAFLVLPGLALVVLAAGAGGWLTRLAQVVAAGAALVVSAGWYVALVELWPAESRPYIGGSSSNSLWELAVDYNGLGRILGNHNGGGHRPTPPATPAADAAAHADPNQMHGGFGGFGSQPGLTRLFTGELATEFSWLLPAALIALIAGLWLTRKLPRTDRLRAGYLLWGGWLLVTAVVLSTMSRSFHSYYSMELAPAMAALIGLGATQLWRHRAHFAARLTLAAMSLATGIWAFVLLNRTPEWLPWLRWILVALAVIAAAALLLTPKLPRFALAIGVFALLAGLIGPTAYTLETVAQVHSGGSPMAGPARAGRDGGPGGQRGGVTDPALVDLINGSTARWAAAAQGAQDVSTLELTTGKALLAVGGFSGRDDSPSLAQFQQYVADHQIGYYLIRQRQNDNQPGQPSNPQSAQPTPQPGHTPHNGRDQQGQGGNNSQSGNPQGRGGNNSQPGNPQGQGGTQGQGGDQGYGGWNGNSDPASSSAQIAAWVKANYPATTIGNVEVYNLNP